MITSYLPLRMDQVVKIVRGCSIYVHTVLARVIDGLKKPWGSGTGSSAHQRNRFCRCRHLLKIGKAWAKNSEAFMNSPSVIRGGGLTNENSVTTHLEDFHSTSPGRDSKKNKVIISRAGYRVQLAKGGKTLHRIFSHSDKSCPGDGFRSQLRKEGRAPSGLTNWIQRGKKKT